MALKIQRSRYEICLALWWETGSGKIQLIFLVSCLILLNIDANLTLDDDIEAEDTIKVVSGLAVASSSSTAPSILSFSLRSRTRHTYCTTREAEIGVETEVESEADITTDSGEDTEDLVDSDNKDDFNPAGDDEDLQEMNID
jgi:hypothetical protein